jgi:hypothetical protein
MFRVALDDLNEEDLKRLLGTTETFRVEFKRELDLTGREKRAEAAKDVSALANSAGGRIYYGIGETLNADGSRTAERIQPLTDFALRGHLEDVVADGIHPRPHCRLRDVPVTGGFVLVVEIYPSVGRDLHMVTTSRRFYRRGETRSIHMSEPEIREAYTRIAANSATLQDSIRRTVSEYVSPQASQAVVTVPWFPRPSLADPRLILEMRGELAEGPFGSYLNLNLPHSTAVANLRSTAGGVLADVPAFHGRFRFGVTRNGTTYLADPEPLVDGQPWIHVLAVSLVRNVIATLRSARLVLQSCNYWGPVWVVQTVHLVAKGRLVIGNNTYGEVLDAGRYQQELGEVSLFEHGDDLEPVAKELLDQLFQAGGIVTCPLFSEDGCLTAEARKMVSA